MTSAYTSVTVSGYNSSPPSDDGSTTSTNRITWAGIKTKLGDPLNTAIASINTNMIAAGAVWDTIIPSGTLMLFQQTSAPTGWTKQTTHNDKALRVVSGTASSGGSWTFSQLFADGDNGFVAAHAITQAELPVVNLSSAGLSAATTTTLTNGTNQIVSSGGTGSGYGGSGTGGAVTITAASTTTISGVVPLGGAGTGHTHIFYGAVQYVDLIIASKD